MTAAVATMPAGGQFVAKKAPVGRLLGSELRWIFRRPRTIVALALLAIFPIALGIGSQVADNGSINVGDQQSLVGAVAGNALVLPIIALLTILMFFLPLVSSVVSADALAGEAANGTLRGLLLAPVSRV